MKKTGILISVASMVLYLGILTDDEMKLKLLTKPFYKLVDSFYLSVFQYYFVLLLMALCLNVSALSENHTLCIVYKGISVIVNVVAVTLTLQQRFFIKSFTNMYKIFEAFPNI